MIFKSDFILSFVLLCYSLSTACDSSSYDIYGVGEPCFTKN